MQICLATLIRTLTLKLLNKILLSVIRQEHEKFIQQWAFGSIETGAAYNVFHLESQGSPRSRCLKILLHVRMLQTELGRKQ